MALVSDIQLQTNAVKPPNLDTSQKFSAEGLTATTAMAVTDAGAGTAAHRATGNNQCVTISLELKFISAIKLGQELIGTVKIQKRTKSMVFLTSELTAANKIVAVASGIWKILKKLPGAGPGG